MLVIFWFKSPGAEIHAVQAADVPDQKAGPSPEIRVWAQPKASGLSGFHGLF